MISTERLMELRNLAADAARRTQDTRVGPVPWVTIAAFALSMVAACVGSDRVFQMLEFSEAV